MQIKIKSRLSDLPLWEATCKRFLHWQMDGETEQSVIPTLSRKCYQATWNALLTEQFAHAKFVQPVPQWWIHKEKILYSRHSYISAPYSMLRWLYFRESVANFQSLFSQIIYKLVIHPKL